jgi:hypothetical protein
MSAMKTPLQPKDFTQVMGAYSHGLRVDVGDLVSALVEINKTVKEGCDIEIEVIAVRRK